MNVQARAQQIFAFFQQHPQGTVQQAAHETGMSPAAAGRHKQGIAKRNQYPESWLWETEVGRKWLVLLVCGVVYFFGIRGGVGMPTMAEFFLAIRLTDHVGTSRRSLARITALIEDLILQYEQTHASAQAPGIAIIAGADETFFDQVVLILMDLESGFILVEEAADDRTFLTWQDRVHRAVMQLGLRIRCLVSDQAMALSKLALEELQCHKVPDLFHALQEVVKLFGGRFARQLASLDRKMAKTRLTLETLRQRGASVTTLIRHEQALAELRATHTHLHTGQTRYYDALHALSLAVHPFSLEQHRPQTANAIKMTMLQTLKTLQTLALDYEIADSKHRLKKVTKQVPEIAAHIDLWWQWVHETLTAYALPDELQDWLCDGLLPSLYWSAQMKRTAPGLLRTAYQREALRAQHHLDTLSLTHTLAPKEQARWQRWETGMVGKFQRTSSAVEGRNGVLSRMNHTQRSIRPRRLRVATVIHNFGIRREDGTTAAERLFGEPFPDVFEWIVEHMNELPLPRERVASASSSGISP
jgi:hypothetical protein